MAAIAVFMSVEINIPFVFLSPFDQLAFIIIVASL